jgi:DNA-binding MarR family transcriptional regulator
VAPDADLLDGDPVGIRRRLHAQFGVTLPRFDLMAQLEKAPDGLTLGQLSRRMMVSNGNVTGLVERLSRDGLLERRTNAADGRSVLVALTKEGRAGSPPWRKRMASGSPSSSGTSRTRKSSV